MPSPSLHFDSRYTMLINPLVAIASVAVRAVSTLLGQTASPTNQYFDTNNYLDEASNELQQFMSHPSPDIKDAVILNREQEQQPTISTSTADKRVKPPPLPDTNNPLILLGLDQGVNDFKTIKAAYKSKAKLFHPDIILSSEASQEERTAANWNFARINSAFDILKRKEEEQVYEYEVYDNGYRETRSVVMPQDNRDPYHINYDRILQNRKRYPQERMWYDQDDGQYEPNHSYRRPRHYDPEPFGDDSEKYSVDAYTKGKWWVAKGCHDHNDVHYKPLADVDYGPSSEQMWEERQQRENYYNAGEGMGRSGFGFGAVDPQWWNDRSASSNKPWSTNSHENYQRENHHARGEMREGYPYKDVHWNDSQPYDNEASSFQPTADYDPQDERFVVREEWWRSDEKVTGEFSP